MVSPVGFTETVRQELARLPPGSPVAVRAELSALVRVAGTLAVVGGTPSRRRIEVTTTSGAVARRAFSLVQRRYGLHPELLVRAPGGVQRRTVYGVRIVPGADHVGRDLEVVDERGRPRDGVLRGLSGEGRVAYVRGALLGAGSVSAPGRSPHLEISVTSATVATALAALVGGVAGGTATVVAGRPSRVVVKSGERIGDLLAAVGASQAFLEFDERRLRRQLRSEANRLANADGANLRRTIDAATAQVRLVEHALATVGWDLLDDELRAVALVRLANPEASLAELGALLDPPVGKSAVHRRLRRLATLADDEAERP